MYVYILERAQQWQYITQRFSGLVKSDPFFQMWTQKVGREMSSEQSTTIWIILIQQTIPLMKFMLHWTKALATFIYLLTAWSSFYNYPNKNLEISPLNTKFIWRKIKSETLIGITLIQE